MFSTQCSIERCFQNIEVTDTLKDIRKDLNTCHLAKTIIIGLHFFDAIRIEAKSDSEEMTGELNLYTHLTVLGSYDYQKCLVYEAFRITRYSKLPWFTLRMRRT